MGFIEFARAAKSTIEQVGSCYTKTTLKKGEGFVPYNRHGVKWGQVDVMDTRLRIVLDLYPGRYKIEEIERMVQIPIKKKGIRRTGMHMDTTTEVDPPYHDVAVISLYPSYFEITDSVQQEAVLSFIQVAASEADFKTDYPDRLIKYKK